MRLNSYGVSIRALIAGISLVGLGVAVALPTLMSAIPPRDVDSIVTGSVDNEDAGAPSQTELPEPIINAEPNASESAQTPRQIVPYDPTQAPSEVPPASATVFDEAEAARFSDDDVLQTSRLTDDDMPDDVITESETALVQPVSDPAPQSSALQGATQPSSAGSSAVVLALDHARIMRLVGDVSTIIIGNPAIADASMPDPATLILTGKSYGETNMVLLNEVGDILAERMLRVTVSGESLVSVYRGVERTTLSCSPTCQIRPTPGDSAAAATAGLNQFNARNQAALQAVGASGQ
ncbi:MAG: pilus assembly protein N-terminal domain-containing protein [Pseudomonadota bacterium]